jgi:hypothetical protein
MLVNSARNRSDFAKSRETREFAYASLLIHVSITRDVIGNLLK